MRTVLAKLSRMPEIRPYSSKILAAVGRSRHVSSRTMAVSSAKALIMEVGISHLTLLMSRSETTAKRRGESGQPCLTPASRENPSTLAPAIAIWQSL